MRPVPPVAGSRNLRVERGVTQKQDVTINEVHQWSHPSANMDGRGGPRTRVADGWRRKPQGFATSCRAMRWGRRARSGSNLGYDVQLHSLIRAMGDRGPHNHADAERLAARRVESDDLFLVAKSAQHPRATAPGLAQHGWLRRSASCSSGA